MDYETRLNDILQTLKILQDGGGEELTSTYWRYKYQQDITWLLKHLGRAKKLNRELSHEIKQLQDDLNLASDNIASGLTKLLEVKERK